MIVTVALIISGISTYTATEPIFGRYTPYVRYIARAFTPPKSLFCERTLYFDHRQGDINAVTFQKMYGAYGTNLVINYGRGFSKNELLQRGLL